jgi:flavin reductase (DIM6/NTAB) family NADH-FMN oxidoreductase RutF
MRQSIAELDARRLLGGGPVVLVSTSWRGNHNVMPAAFVTPLSFDPPLIGLAVHPSRHTHDMIKYSEEFALNIPSRELLHHCQYLGSVSGRDLSKLELTKLPIFSARRVSAPLLDGCVGYIECGVHDAMTTGDHTLFIGKVVAAQVEKEAFDGTWLLDDDELKPLNYLGQNLYALLGEPIAARIPKTGDEASTEEQIESGVAEAGSETEQRREKASEEAEHRRREGTDEQQQERAEEAERKRREGE